MLVSVFLVGLLDGRVFLFRPVYFQPLSLGFHPHLVLMWLYLSTSVGLFTVSSKAQTFEGML